MKTATSVKFPLQTGTRVKFLTNETTEAWGIAGKTGTVIGPDPRGINVRVSAVRVDDVPHSIAESKGIHVGHFVEFDGPASSPPPPEGSPS